MARKQPEVHPAANIFPMLDDAAFERLKDDINRNGQRESVVYFDGKLLDGRNRERACTELGKEVEECELEECEDPVAYVLSANLHRRQLKTSQRAMCAARMATLPNHRPDKSLNLGSYTAEDAAKLFGVSVASIEFARRVLREGCDELIALCEAGKSVATACDLIGACTSKREQSSIALNGWSAIREHLATPEDDEADDDTEEEDKPHPHFKKFKVLWDAADEIGRAAIRAYVLGE